MMEEKTSNPIIRLIENIWPYVVAVGVAFFINSFILVNATVPSGSMQNTLMPGDRFFGNRLAYITSDPERFDIIVFHYPDDESVLYVKRIIGLPGETVEIKNGKVYIDGAETPLDDSFIPEPMKGSFGPYTVPEGSYFMLGDNRNNSWDSRKWTNTFVKKEKIVGKAMFRYWPLTSIGGLH